MSDQQQQRQEGTDGREGVPIIDAEKPAPESQRLKTLFDDLESKQLDRLDESGKGLIERVGTFLGILFAITVLSSNFPPPFLKGNAAANIAAKTIVIIALFCFLLSLGSAIWATQVVRSYRHYLYNMTLLAGALQKMIRHKKLWLQLANLLFALGVVALAVLLIVVVWSV
jgi:hypothetical protein